jgi:5,10-methylenetetrahydromethanopterin reductase
MEIWQVNFPYPGSSARMARRAEDAGWDGLAFGDSQCRTGDVYVGLTAAAAATSTLKLCTGVTNPVTRHASVTAAAIAAVHRESAGRATLGIGRGDSALGHIRASAPPLRDFERYVRDVQTYLSGHAVDIDGFASELIWLKDSELAKVHVDVAASGPKTIEMAARNADGVVLTLGADVGRISAAIDAARAQRDAVGLDPSDFTIGAYVNIMVNDNVDHALDVVAGAALTMARFSARASFASQDAENYTLAQQSYELTNHASSDSAHGTTLDRDFLDRFAIVGSAARVIDRLRELEAVGVEKVIALFNARGASREETALSLKRFAAEVIPALH